MKVFNLKNLFSFITFLVLIVFFQNCGDTPVDLRLSLPSSDIHTELDIKGEICLDTGYSLKSLTVLNNSIKPDIDSLNVDTDKDGLTDKFEEQIGFDPLNNRSMGRVLDGVCFNLRQGGSCEDLNIVCEDQELDFGLSDCDVAAMNLQQTASPLIGLDSDEDGILDYFEISFEMDPVVNDALLDYDNDSVSNRQEVFQGSHPRKKESKVKLFPQETLSTKLSFSQSDCGGEMWAFTSEGIRVYKLLSPDKPDLEFNDIWVIAHIERADSNLNVQKDIIYAKISELFQGNEKIYIDLKTEDFEFAEKFIFSEGGE